MELLLQFALLAFTALVWWLARRDLTERAARIRAGEAEELGRLRDSVEQLAADLERRAVEAEARLAAHVAEARALSARPPDTSAPPDSGGEGADDRYGPALALAAIGVTDPAEIARRTGLGRGEVELLLNVRARRAP
ncbi:MAG: hypothetical protein JO250_18115 [Armatimonadetes bacterium]|nr:hypothetical protein [Armatimonadota bacterium]